MTTGTRLKPIQLSLDGNIPSSELKQFLFTYVHLPNESANGNTTTNELNNLRDISVSFTRSNRKKNCQRKLHSRSGTAVLCDNHLKRRKLSHNDELSASCLFAWRLMCLYVRAAINSNLFVWLSHRYSSSTGLWCCHQHSRFGDFAFVTFC